MQLHLNLSFCCIYGVCTLVHHLLTVPLAFSVELPVLDNELYHAVKPGLSAYKDNPEEVCAPVHTITCH